MTRSFSRLASLATFGLALAVCAAGLWGASASASPAGPTGAGPTRIGPRQHFAGMVNGKMRNAIVKVVCPGPSSTRGRALPRQTISVTSPPVIAANFGYTGSKGRAITASVGPAASVADTVTFTRYNHARAFPTNIPVPCSGTGTVVFSPMPHSQGAEPATVTVTYANVATR